MKIERITRVTKEILVLAETAEREGHSNIQTLVAEHSSGKNRFRKEGEGLFAGVNGAKLRIVAENDNKAATEPTVQPILSSLHDPLR